MSAERIVVLGDALLDVVARADTPLAATSDVPGRVALHPGGQGANVAVRLARRGPSVRLVAALADDPAGRLLRHMLADEGIDLTTVSVAASGSAVVLVDDAGERTMLSQRAPFAALIGEDLLLRTPARWLVVSGYLLLEPEADLLIGRLAAVAPEIVLLGCALPAPAAAASWARLAAASGAALVIVNAAEAGAMLTAVHGAAGPGDAGPVNEASRAEALAGMLGSRVVVTGDGGAAAATPDGVLAAAPAAGAGPVIDTTGAGDAFSAAVIASLTRGEALEAALRAGVTLAAAVARVEGAQARVSDEPRGTLDA